MSEEFGSFPAPGDPEQDDAGRVRVRTYRGRTIEELIPRIRAELGPDAIILREREGLTGGIGGFFAQRCVEIDAQAAPRLSVYDDDFDEEELEDEEYDDEPVAPPASETAPPLARAPAPPPAPADPPARPAAPFLDEASFAARLEEATFATEQEPAPAVRRAPEPPRPPAPTFIAFDELGDDEPEPAPEPVAEATPEPEPITGVPPASRPDQYGLIDLAEIGGEEPAGPAAAAPEPEPADVKPDPSAPWMTFAEQVAPAIPERPAPAPRAPAPPASAAPPPPAAPPSAPGSTGWPPSSVYGPRRRGGILPAAERMLRAALEATAAANERRNLELQARAESAASQLPPPFAQPPPPAAAPGPVPAAPPSSPAPAASPPAPAPHPEPEADDRARRRAEEHRREAQLQERLVQSGISPRRGATIVSAAISRRGPFSGDSELIDQVRSAIVSALPAPRPVPRRGAIAVVGAGGSGKTRCVAALAAAYADAGIPVSVASFGGPAREDELGELLHGQEVNVIPAMRTRATARAVASVREEALVIIDTASATPGDDSTVDVIAEALRSFELDAIYLAVPATVSLPAGLKLVDGFSAFDLTGLIATHLDETDELGVIAELAIQTGTAVAYTHTGLDLQNAIASADAVDIATSLLSGSN
ncbi:MAG TPA: hypothetical protein VG325_06700 [Solirubrobacteraceae bacterium]|nr:hypothetical protein [Solirubrobacteraceae bacterium]